MHIGSFFGTWVLYYLVGLEWRERFAPWLARRGFSISRTAGLLLCCLALQEAEGFFWLSFGSFDLATTQMKATSCLTALAAIAFLMALRSGRAGAIASRSRALVGLGNLSFGIYLCHIAPVMLWGHLFPTGGALLACAEWAFVVGASVLVMLACRRFLPKRVLAALGFG